MISRGEVWWAELASPRRSEPGYRRPVLVVSADSFNRSQINTVLVAAISSSVALANAPGNVGLAVTDCGLGKESVVNVSQVVTLDKRQLDSKAGDCPPTVMQRVDDGLSLVLGPTPTVRTVT